MNLIKYRNWFFAFSLAIVVPGMLALYAWQLKLGIDFAGGTLWEVKFSQENVTPKNLQDYLVKNGEEVSQIVKTDKNTMLIRLKATDEAKTKEIKQKVVANFGNYEEIRLETVGPVISKELTQKAAKAVAVSLLGIVVYITWAFRKVPRPTSAIAFALCTIAALVHDIIVVAGAFAILGHFFGIEVDTLFITALLTVLGFSVHDTIVVFDRIRENLRKHSDLSFEEVVNHSLLQTIGRSLNTSLTVVFVLLALLLFGGESIKTFVLALLIGIISGTYSSIFNAAPLLVVWQKFKNK